MQISCSTIIWLVPLAYLKSLSLLLRHFGPSLLSYKEPNQGHNRETTEASRGNIERHVASSDCLDLKQVCGLVGLGCLTISHLNVIWVVSIGAYKVRGSRHVTLYCPLEALDCFVSRIVRSRNDQELACLVFCYVVNGLSPRAVYLAYGRVA